MSLYKIMIVDDEAEVRQAIARKIDWRAVGFEIVADAENGRDALEKAETLDLDVVLTDIKMPFMDGLELGAELSRRKPNLKLIVFSGFDEFEYAKEAIKLIVVEYVLKPVNAAELTAILDRVRKVLDEEIEQRRNISQLTQAYQESLPLLREKFLQDLMRGPMDPRVRHRPRRRSAARPQRRAGAGVGAADAQRRAPGPLPERDRAWSLLHLNRHFLGAGPGGEPHAHSG